MVSTGMLEWSGSFCPIESGDAIHPQEPMQF
jgi:hypothetical protein